MVTFDLFRAARRSNILSGAEPRPLPFIEATLTCAAGGKNPV